MRLVSNRSGMIHHQVFVLLGYGPVSEKIWPGFKKNSKNRGRLDSLDSMTAGRGPGLSMTHCHAGNRLAAVKLRAEGQFGNHHQTVTAKNETLSFLTL
jgi:hypothetical protein